MKYIKPTLLKQNSLFTLILFAVFILSACKKDQLKVDRDKLFSGINSKIDPSMPYNVDWHLNLYPDGNAVVVPGSDISFSGPYKISGKNLTVKTQEEIFKFEILSETELREQKYSVILRLTDY